MSVRFWVVCIAATALSLPAAAQRVPSTETAAPTPPPPSSAAPTPAADVYGGYMIGVGDILDIRVRDEDAITGRYQVDPDGRIQLPLLSSPVPASGLTTFDLSAKLGDELRRQEILREPSVTVFIVRGMSQNATVLGAVARPGIYTLEQPTTLLELISRAGGLQPNAGRELTIARRSAPDPANRSALVPTAAGGHEAANQNQTMRTVDLSALMSGKQLGENLLVQPGDVITIGTAPVVFVVGAVTRPGAFTVQSPRAEMTVLQAVAMAEGVLPTASQGKTVIVRQSANQAERKEIPIDLKDVIRGKQPDQVLLANDILFIPESGFKAGLRRMSDVAVQAAGRVTAYGLYSGL
jgi:polysaccharide export outer membrane protein